MKDLISRVWEYSRQNPEGFTLDLKTMKPISEGICVGYQATQDSHSRESLERVINHALRHEGIVGGWFNVVNSLYYFDSVRIFPEAEKDKAIQFAKEQEQISIYNLKTGDYIETNK